MVLGCGMKSLMTYQNGAKRFWILLISKYLAKIAIYPSLLEYNDDLALLLSTFDLNNARCQMKLSHALTHKKRPIYCRSFFMGDDKRTEANPTMLNLKNR